jgi:hypothetical protein
MVFPRVTLLVKYCASLNDLVKSLSLGERKRGRKSKMNVCDPPSLSLWRGITVLAMGHMNNLTVNKQIYQLVLIFAFFLSMFA